ncbi:hypothetical protein AN958_11591 [Leucoagaricus sp. SymC.cos]|nr:hypothetical protein AN958_11591 [Leucoagaricus sp. SymC.cos]
MSRSNVVLFGQSGGGKSSIVNMLSIENERVADVLGGARGCTFESREYEFNILGEPVRLWDTAGLNEGDAGRVPSSDAIVQLYSLLRNLVDSGGVSLLMFVVRKGPITGSVGQNWKLFSEVICQSRVPTVIAITGCEQEENMDEWWWNNKGDFQDYGILPNGFACITATRGRPLRNGKGHLLDDFFEESREKVQGLIRSTSLRTPWCVPPAEWFKTVVHITYREGGWCDDPEEVREYEEVEGEALRKLQSVCGMSRDEARELAEKMRSI